MEEWEGLCPRPADHRFEKAVNLSPWLNLDAIRGFGYNEISVGPSLFVRTRVSPQQPSITIKRP